MAKEAYYFQHDSNASRDEKMIALRMKHNWAGYGIYWALIEKLRDSSEYQCVKDYNMIAFDLRTDAAIVKSIIEEFGLFVFTECGKYFYSERLRSNMLYKESKSTKARESATARWGKNANAMRTHNERNATAMLIKENKEKEKKEDDVERAQEFPPPPSQDFSYENSSLKRFTNEENAKRIKTSPHVEQSCMAMGLTKEQIPVAIGNFVLFRNSTYKLDTDLQDFSSHFMNWLKTKNPTDFIPRQKPLTADDEAELSRKKWQEKHARRNG